jgi:hypothetical protein
MQAMAAMTESRILCDRFTCECVTSMVWSSMLLQIQQTKRGKQPFSKTAAQQTGAAA